MSEKRITDLNGINPFNIDGYPLLNIAELGFLQLLSYSKNVLEVGFHPYRPQGRPKPFLPSINGDAAGLLLRVYWFEVV